jgi:DNA-directed RNA polymerase subunit beta
MDVSPKEVVSVGTSMIPFLENDDANRALMGANMQRQAVPLTAYPGSACRGRVWNTRQPVTPASVSWPNTAGEVTRVTGDEIEVTTDTGALVEDRYRLIKFMRSNQSTCINQRPHRHTKAIRSSEGQVLADGMATDGGELASGLQYPRCLYALGRLQLRRCCPAQRRFAEEHDIIYVYPY